MNRLCLPAAQVPRKKFKLGKKAKLYRQNIAIHIVHSICSPRALQEVYSPRFCCCHGCMLQHRVRVISAFTSEMLKIGSSSLLLLGWCSHTVIANSSSMNGLNWPCLLIIVTLLGNHKVLNKRKSTDSIFIKAQTSLI